MRQKMETHRVRQDCTQCHSMMDPIGFALENFDGIALWRSHDEGQDINPVTQVFDGTKIASPTDVRNWLVSKYSNQFVQVASEKLLIYALGRGIEYYDASAVRSAVRAAATSDYKFATLVAGLAKSAPFQMRETSQPAASSGRPAAR